MTHLEYIRELCKKPSDSFYFEIANAALLKCKDHELERIIEVCQKTISWRKNMKPQTDSYPDVFHNTNFEKEEDS